MWKAQKTEAKADVEQHVCVISWNVNKSSAQCDILRDMAHIQADVAILQETQNWKKGGVANEGGWRLFFPG